MAGQVFDADGLPVKNLVVKAGGTWNAAAVNLLGMTGTSTAYGEGGYELVLGNKAVISTNTVWVQVFDLASKPVTDKVYVSTSSDCTKNLDPGQFQRDRGRDQYLHPHGDPDGCSLSYKRSILILILL